MHLLFVWKWQDPPQSPTANQLSPSPHLSSPVVFHIDASMFFTVKYFTNCTPTGSGGTKWCPHLLQKNRSGTHLAGWGPGGSSEVQRDRMGTASGCWLCRDYPNPTEHHSRWPVESAPSGETEISRTYRKRSHECWPARWKWEEWGFTSGGRGTDEGLSCPSWSHTQKRSFLLWANHRKEPAHRNHSRSDLQDCLKVQ